MSGELTYRKDSTFECFADAGVRGSKLHFKVAGKWKVDGGRLINEYTESNMPEAVPVGKIESDRILSITDKELVYITEGGKRSVCKRK